MKMLFSSPPSPSRRIPPGRLYVGRERFSTAWGKALAQTHPSLFGEWGRVWCQGGITWGPRESCLVQVGCEGCEVMLEEALWCKCGGGGGYKSQRWESPVHSEQRDVDLAAASPANGMDSYRELCLHLHHPRWHAASPLPLPLSAPWQSLESAQPPHPAPPRTVPHGEAVEGYLSWYCG